MISKAIKYIFDNTSGITGYTGNRYYPVVAPVDCVTPFIVYQSALNAVTYTKSGREMDEYTTDFLIVSSNYTEVLNLTQIIRQTLEFKRGNYNGINISDIRVNNDDELWNDDTKEFMKRINMTIKVS
jgi:hypothetical protein